MVVIEREFLLAMGRVISMIEVEHNGGGRLGVAGDEMIDQGMGKSVEVLAVDAVFKTRKGGGTRQVLRGLQGEPLHAELRRFLKKNFLIQEVGAGLIKMSYLGNAGWRSNRFSTACIAAFPSAIPFW